MESKLIKMSEEELKDNVFKLIRNDWMLITAGDINAYNTMTASWGAMGSLWSKNVCFCFIRPTRHTRLFVEKNKNFTLSFFEDRYRGALDLCGSVSGKDNKDKAKDAGLTPLKSPAGSVYFSEARLLLECKKIYFQDLNPANFMDESIGSLYQQKDYHRMYVGEITGCYINK